MATSLSRGAFEAHRSWLPSLFSPRRMQHLDPQHAWVASATMARSSLLADQVFVGSQDPFDQSNDQDMGNTHGARCYLRLSPCALRCHLRYVSLVTSAEHRVRNEETVLEPSS